MENAKKAETSSIESGESGPNTVDPDEIARFSAMAAQWWDPMGKFRPLHTFNPVRLAYIKENVARHYRSEEHTSELQSLMRISYAVFCWKKQKNKKETHL